MELTSDEVTKRLNRRGYLDLEIPEGLDLVSAIKRLKKRKKAVLLVHYYQEAEIQELADYLGDSLYLAQAAEKVEAETIVFCRSAFYGRNCQNHQSHTKSHPPGSKCRLLSSRLLPASRF